MLRERGVRRRPSPLGCQGAGATGRGSSAPLLIPPFASLGTQPKGKVGFHLSPQIKPILMGNHFGLLIRTWGLRSGEDPGWPFLNPDFLATLDEFIPWPPAEGGDAQRALSCLSTSIKKKKKEKIIWISLGGLPNSFQVY